MKESQKKVLWVRRIAHFGISGRDKAFIEASSCKGNQVKFMEITPKKNDGDCPRNFISCLV